MKHHSLLLVLVSLLGLSGCNKESGQPGQGSLPGNVLYDSGEHTYQVNLNTNTKSVYFDRNSYSHNGWDVSWDGKVRLESQIVTGTFNQVRFRLVNTENNSVVKQLDYKTVNGEGRDTRGLLSPDQKLILIQPDFDHGIVIIDTDGNVKHHLPMVNETKLTLGDEAIWLPDNSLIFTFNKKYILKTSPPYTQITPVKEMNDTEWGKIHANAQGSKLSLCIDKHIYLMNPDGTGLVQVTESDRQEREAVFSPDGNYLLVGAEYYPATFRAGTWTLNVIPADGKKYKVGTNPGPGVIALTAEGEGNAEQGSDQMLWR